MEASDFPDSSTANFLSIDSHYLKAGRGLNIFLVQREVNKGLAICTWDPQSVLM
jgi:hypothetical protein